MTDLEKKDYLLFISFGLKSIPNAETKFIQMHREPNKATLIAVINNLERALGNIRNSNFNLAFRSQDGRVLLYCIQSPYSANVIKETLVSPHGHGAFRKEPIPDGLRCNESDCIFIAEIGGDFDAHALDHTMAFLTI